MSHETEKLLTCPYNKAHTILRYRMQTHLHKCRKQHSSEDWGYCSHNGTHHMPRMELEWHQNHMCPDRHSFQARFAVLDDVPRKSIAPIEHIQVPESTENWDDGLENHFNPAENARQKSLIRGVHCVPPAERKAFKLDHRRHLQERAEAEPEPVRRQPKKQPEVGPLEPLRPPKDLPKGFTFARGSKMCTDEVAKSPGISENMANLSLESQRGEQGASAAITTPSIVSSQDQMKWSGFGRGRLMSPPAPLPVASAWGRGRPNF